MSTRHTAFDTTPAVATMPGISVRTLRNLSRFSIARWLGPGRIQGISAGTSASSEAMVLVTMIDDATSKLLVRFYPSDTVEAHLDLLGRWLTKYGRPLSLARHQPHTLPNGRGSFFPVPHFSPREVYYPIAFRRRAFADTHPRKPAACIKRSVA